MCRWDKGRISEEVILGQGGPASNDSVLRRDRRGDADPEEKPHGDGGRDGRDVANSLGTRRTPEAGRGGKAPPWSLCREHSPGHLDLRRLVSRVGEGECLLLWNASFVILGYGSSGSTQSVCLVALLSVVPTVGRGMHLSGCISPTVRRDPPPSCDLADGTEGQGGEERICRELDLVACVTALLVHLQMGGRFVAQTPAARVDERCLLTRAKAGGRCHLLCLPP